MSIAATPSLTIVKKSLQWSIAASVVMTLAGFLAVVVPKATGIAVTVFVGCLLVFIGAAHLVFAWHRRSSGGSCGSSFLVLSIFSLVAVCW